MAQTCRTYRTHAHKLATYHAWMALPLKPSTAWGPLHLPPRHLLDL